MQTSSREVPNLSAVTLDGWITEGNGFHRATMSKNKGITITEKINPDGSTDFIFIHTASPTPNQAPVQK